MINRPTGSVATIDLTQVVVTGTPLTPITNAPLTARPDALRQLKAGVLGPYPSLAALDQLLKGLVAHLRTTNGVWDTAAKTLGTRCRDGATLLGIRTSTTPALPTPDLELEHAATRLRQFATELGAK